MPSFLFPGAESITTDPTNAYPVYSLDGDVLGYMPHRCEPGLVPHEDGFYGFSTQDSMFHCFNKIYLIDGEIECEWETPQNECEWAKKYDDLFQYFLEKSDDSPNQFSDVLNLYHEGLLRFYKVKQ